MSYHRSESEARKWLTREGYDFLAFKLGNSEPADYLAIKRYEKGFDIKLVEVKSVRASVWRLRASKRQVRQFEELKAYSEAHGIPAFYLISLVHKHKRVWRFVSLAEVEEKGKVVV